MLTLKWSKTDMNKRYLSKRRTRPLSVAAVAVLTLLALWCVPSATAQEPLRPALSGGEKKLESTITDTAGLFSSDAVKEAREHVERIEHSTHVATVIHTVESLRGQKLEDAAIRAARKSAIEGIFILIAKNEKEIELLVSKKYRALLNGQRQAAMRAGFIEGFKKQDFDEGLKRGVTAIAEQLSAAFPAEPVPRMDTTSAVREFATSTPAVATGNSPLVIRDQVRLSLAGARAMIAGAEVKATEMKIKVNIAAVDEGGHLLAFERMDGARPASLYTAITKATSAATFRQATGPLAAGSAPADPLLNISLQNAAQASGGKVTALLGGVPAVVDGQTIGAVGIAGGTGEQDAQIAHAGVQAFMDQLAKTETPARTAATPEKPE